MQFVDAVFSIDQFISWFQCDEQRIGRLNRIRDERNVDISNIIYQKIV